MKDNARSSDGVQQMEVLTDLLQAQGALGVQALSLLGAGVGGLVRAALDLVPRAKTSSCCDIPEPCWMPRSLGERDCRVCAGINGSMRLVVTNEDIQARTVYALASGPAAAQVAFTPGALSLGPKERGTITAVFGAPLASKPGEQFETLIWLRGCRDYYLRWTIVASVRAQSCCDEITVSDGPDQVLHWYHHFYCQRQCFGSAKAG